MHFTKLQISELCASKLRHKMIHWLCIIPSTAGLLQAHGVKYYHKFYRKLIIVF